MYVWLEKLPALVCQMYSVSEAWWCPPISQPNGVLSNSCRWLAFEKQGILSIHSIKHECCLKPHKLFVGSKLMRKPFWGLCLHGLKGQANFVHEGYYPIFHGFKQRKHLKLNINAMYLLFNLMARYWLATRNCVRSMDICYQFTGILRQILFQFLKLYSI